MEVSAKKDINVNEAFIKLIEQMIKLGIGKKRKRMGGIDDEEEMKQFCEKNSFLRCFKTSAKTGTNIDESMNFLISTIIDKMESLAQTGTNPFEKNRESMVLQSKKHNENSKENTSNGCC